jgi:3-oxoacyl-[acyl-carrier-protein] synthase-3
MSAWLHSLATALPDRSQSNEELANGTPGWTGNRIEMKTGIRARRVAAADETAGDLCARAAERLFADRQIDRAAIDALIVCTQSPDYFLPSTACILQDRLQLPQTCAAFDVTLGCSGYTYGLWLARSLILAESACKVLLLTGDTYTKYCRPTDLGVASLFGDGAAATLITNQPDNAWAEIGPSVLGTDGRGAPHLIVPAGAARHPLATPEVDRALHMNGAEIASFAVATIKPLLQRLLDKLGRSWDEVEYFLFHQANPAFVQRLAGAYRLPLEKVPIGLAEIGNTCSATIPMLLEECVQARRFQPGDRLLLAGFGVGYSWAATALEWRA